MATKKPKFRRIDAPWVDETAALYRQAGLLRAFAPGPGVVDLIVRAFDARFGRPPKWNTPFENERLLALDQEHVFVGPLDSVPLRAEGKRRLFVVENDADDLGPMVVVLAKKDAEHLRMNRGIRFTPFAR